MKGRRRAQGRHGGAHALLRRRGPFQRAAQGRERGDDGGRVHRRAGPYRHRAEGGSRPALRPALHDDAGQHRPWRHGAEHPGARGRDHLGVPVLARPRSAGRRHARASAGRGDRAALPQRRAVGVVRNHGGDELSRPRPRSGFACRDAGARAHPAPMRSRPRLTAPKPATSPAPASPPSSAAPAPSSRRTGPTNSSRSPSWTPARSSCAGSSRKRQPDISCHSRRGSLAPRAVRRKGTQVQGRSPTRRRHSVRTPRQDDRLDPLPLAALSRRSAGG